MGVMQAIYFSGNNESHTYSIGDQPDELWSKLIIAFPWIDAQDYFSVSTPIFHEVLQEEVITCCLPFAYSKYTFGEKVFLTTRKFCLSSKTSFLRTYEIFEGAQPACIPESIQILFVGKNHAEYMRPYPETVSDITDYYFGGTPQTIEDLFKLEPKRGKYETWYSATVVEGSVKRVKQYCSDDQNKFSDWDVAYLMQQKKLGLNP